MQAVTHAVLVHGIWEKQNEGLVELSKVLEAKGVECITPSLKPADGREGMIKMAQQLKSDINKAFGKNQKFILISYSMGGLISRLYLQDLDGAKRCNHFTTISTPHHGTQMAHLHYGKGAAEMRPNSVFLNDLQMGESRLGKMPIVSYRTPYDAIIVPSESSDWDLADNVVIQCPLHPMMTSSKKLRADLMKRFAFPR